jgi:uncharacterized protein
VIASTNAYLDIVGTGYVKLLQMMVEPLIDMGRTAMNVSGATTVGTVTSRILGQTNLDVFNSDARVDLDAGTEAAQAA